MTIQVSKATIRANVFKNFYDLIVSINGFTNIVYPTFPDEVLDGESDYPVIVINPASVDWSTFTFKKNKCNGTISIDVYTITNKDTDAKSDSIQNKIETSKGTLADNGLHEVNLEPSNSNMIPHGKIKVFIQTLVFNYKFISSKTQTY